MEVWKRFRATLNTCCLNIGSFIDNILIKTLINVHIPGIGLQIPSSRKTGYKYIHLELRERERERERVLAGLNFLHIFYTAQT